HLNAADDPRLFAGSDPDEAGVFGHLHHRTGECAPRSFHGELLCAACAPTTIAAVLVAGVPRDRCCPWNSLLRGWIRALRTAVDAAASGEKSREQGNSEPIPRLTAEFGQA